MEKIIDTYIKLLKQSEKEFLNSFDVDSIKYNVLAKKLFTLRKEINEMKNYEEVYEEILKRTDDKKYWQMHSDIGNSLYIKDKLLGLKILKIHFNKNELHINEWEKELRDEGQL